MSDLRHRIPIGAAVLVLVGGLTIAAAVVFVRRGESNQRLLGQARSYVRCMRSHDLPSFPDPTLRDGVVDIRTPASVQHAKPYASAQAACVQLLPMASGVRRSGLER